MKKMTNAWYIDLGFIIFIGIMFVIGVWVLISIYNEEKLENNHTLEEIYKKNRTNSINTKFDLNDSPGYGIDLSDN